MANELKGEAFLAVGDKRYRLVASIDAILAIESMFSTPEKRFTWQDAMAALQKESVEHLRAVFWSFFQTYHPEVELADIGRLIHESGGLDNAAAVMQRVLNAGDPDPKDVADLGLRNPHKAQAGKTNPRSRGTGERSTSTPAASV